MTFLILMNSSGSPTIWLKGGAFSDTQLSGMDLQAVRTSPVSSEQKLAFMNRRGVIGEISEFRRLGEFSFVNTDG